MVFVATNRNDLQKARRYLQEALLLAWQLQDYQQFAYVLDAAACVALRDENVVLAVRLKGAVKSQRIQNQLPLPPRQNQLFEEKITQLQADIGRDVCLELLEEGGACSPEQVLEMAFMA